MLQKAKGLSHYKFGTGAPVAYWQGAQMQSTPRSKPEQIYGMQMGQVIGELVVLRVRG
jgi:hypothetical protein